MSHATWSGQEDCLSLPEVHPRSCRPPFVAMMESADLRDGDDCALNDELGRSASGVKDSPPAEGTGPRSRCAPTDGCLEGGARGLRGAGPRERVLRSAWPRARRLPDSVTADVDRRGGLGVPHAPEPLVPVRCRFSRALVALGRTRYTAGSSYVASLPEGRSFAAGLLISGSQVRSLRGPSGGSSSCAAGCQLGSRPLAFCL